MGFELTKFSLAVVCVCDEVREEYSELLSQEPITSLKEYSGVGICGFNKKLVTVEKGIPECHRNIPER